MQHKEKVKQGHLFQQIQIVKQVKGLKNMDISYSIDQFTVEEYAG